jgi:hypothetical protein
MEVNAKTEATGEARMEIREEERTEPRGKVVKRKLWERVQGKIKRELMRLPMAMILEVKGKDQNPKNFVKMLTIFKFRFLYYYLNLNIVETKF